VFNVLLYPGFSLGPVKFEIASICELEEIKDSLFLFRKLPCNYSMSSLAFSTKESTETFLLGPSY
jgi:hypothetical protein